MSTADDVFFRLCKSNAMELAQSPEGAAVLEALPTELKQLVKESDPVKFWTALLLGCDATFNADSRFTYGVEDEEKVARLFTNFDDARKMFRHLKRKSVSVGPGQGQLQEFLALCRMRVVTLTAYKAGESILKSVDTAKSALE